MSLYTDHDMGSIMATSPWVKRAQDKRLPVKDMTNKCGRGDDPSQHDEVK